MGKNIWVISKSKKELLEMQRKINATGSMRALCIMSEEALQKAIHELAQQMISIKRMPSLILLDYVENREENDSSLFLIKQQVALAGVPLFFMVESTAVAVEEDCYKAGAAAVLRKPFSDIEIMRIEQTAWQHEVTKEYEKMLQKQASELQSAKQIRELNNQLQTRNELLHQIFGRYFSDKVVEVILKQPKGAAIGGDKRNITVMMSDLRGFTSVCESLDSDAVTDLLNYYFGEMLEIITRHNGTVIEFLGDGILAVFGAPIVSKQQNQDALAAAICMQNKMEDVNLYCAKKGYPVLEMGIGIHAGEVFIGNVGSEKMMRYNVIGRVVNQCSRIESCSVGGQVLVSQTVLDSLQGKVQIKNRIEILAKGLTKTMEVYEVTKMENEKSYALNQIPSDVFYPVLNPVIFNLYPVQEKMVSDNCVCTRLEAFSGKRAVVYIVESEVAPLMELIDVEVFAAEQNGKGIFTNVYAKIMEIQGQRITLCFTHINKGFQNFSDKILKQIPKE